MDAFQFQVDLEVRNYELDFQGVVNNAVYQQYLEHANHRFLERMGIETVAMRSRGIYLVMTRIEMNYLHPLRGGDAFSVLMRISRESRLRYSFQHGIFRRPDGKPILNARLHAAAVNAEGRPTMPKELEMLLFPWCGLQGSVTPMSRVEPPVAMRAE